MSKVICTGFRKCERNTLRGFANFLFPGIEPARRRHRHLGVVQEKRLELLRQFRQPDLSGVKPLQQFQ